MANKQRPTAPGAANQGSFNKGRVTRPGAAPLPSPLPNRPQVQPKQAKNALQHVHQQIRVAGPHINQHSAHLQRAAQAKMAQPKMVQAKMVQPQAVQKVVPKQAVHARGVTKSPIQPKFRNAAQLRGANRTVSPLLARSSGVVQPSCFSGVADFFGSCWRGMTSCWNSPRAQYDEIPDGGVALTENNAPRRVETPMIRARLVDQEDTVNNMAYPGGVHGGLITSCALVIFCGDDSFDCYHASGGTFSGNHGMRRNPTRIYYVYKSLVTDSRETVQEYERNARLFQNSGGRAPLTFRGQRGVNGNVMVDVISATEIRSTLGEFI